MKLTLLDDNAHNKVLGAASLEITDFLIRGMGGEIGKDLWVSVLDLDNSNETR